MQTQWFSHLKDKQEQDKFKNLILGSQKVLDRLHEICYNVVQSRELTSHMDYDSPSWAYKEADRQGYLRAYREIMKLITIKE